MTSRGLGTLEMPAPPPMLGDTRGVSDSPSLFRGHHTEVWELQCYGAMPCPFREAGTMTGLSCGSAGMGSRRQR